MNCTHVDNKIYSLLQYFFFAMFTHIASQNQLPMEENPLVVMRESNEIRSVRAII